MEKRPLDADNHREIGDLAAVRHRAPDLLIPDDKGPPRNAKRFAFTGDKEDQADAWILQHVVERIDAAVAATIRNGKGRIVETPDETRPISLWRQIHQAQRIGLTHPDERRC